MAFSGECRERPIVLIGMMGAGKTHAGRLLADRLGLPFHDSDAAIVAETGVSVAELFAREGEARFRERERQIVARLLDGPQAVIAAGGGAVLDAWTRALMKARAVTVWIDADPRLLAERLKGKTDRPLLQGGNLLATLTRLSAERRAFYAEADIQLIADHRPHEVLAQRIEAELVKYFQLQEIAPSRSP